ncbi:hypothetical protein V475_12600 [Sphingobium baderi LL03]|uniref:Uncharacterized protein n=1 Tax=Sphingobium baderi LL03 TaxID=1114964 RepID=T0GES2_9SPHN|nr:hypothetical protein L485_17845 [Sphingobium baderi LL03]KMS61635.1 hypothetical protein V475_12600 [Sphingobium baderi LL03]
MATGKQTHIVSFAMARSVPVITVASSIRTMRLEYIYIF